MENSTDNAQKKKEIINRMKENYKHSLEESPEKATAYRNLKNVGDCIVQALDDAKPVYEQSVDELGDILISNLD